MTPEQRPHQDPLSREIDAALEGVNLQDIDQPARPAARSGGGDRGERALRGSVVEVRGDDVFIELGPRQQGVAPLADFDDAPAPGQVFEFQMRGREESLWLLSRKKAQAIATEIDVQPGALVKARITGQNTGGLEARVGSLSAFLPASQVGLGREDNLGQYLTQTLTCEVVEVDPARRRIVLSRRKVLEREREESRKETVGSLSVGQVVKGKVTRVEEFGAFVEIGGGLEGLIHVSNLSHKRVEKAGEVLQPGQMVEAQILKIEDGGKRIGLGMKQLQPDPWSDVGRKYQPDSVLTGKVTRLMEFGAFVELEPGVEGLVHVSQLAKDRVRRPSDVVKPGQEITVRVLAVEKDRSRISLSRLDPRGALIGSEDSVDSEVIDQALREQNTKPIGTNLGALFQRMKKPAK